MKAKLFPLIFPVFALFFNVFDVFGQGTAFTYQGRLSDNGTPANGKFDMVFTLFVRDDPLSDTIVGGPLTNTNVVVADGLFTTTIDFGSAPFVASIRYLGIAVRPAGNGPFTTLLPRQAITPTPTAIYATQAGTSAQVTGPIPTSQLSGTIPANILDGTIPPANIAAGSITASKLASSSVTSVKIVAGAVTQLGTPDGNTADAVQTVNGGDVAVKGGLTVNGGKGIVYNRYSTQKMLFTATAGLAVKNLGVNASVDGTLNWGNLGFTSAPAVFVGDFNPTTTLDNYSQMIVTAHSVTKTGCSVRILNAGNASGSFSGDFNCLIIGDR